VCIHLTSPNFMHTQKEWKNAYYFAFHVVDKY
jgi:hypothetical protein